MNESKSALYFLCSDKESIVHCMRSLTAEHQNRNCSETIEAAVSSSQAIDTTWVVCDQVVGSVVTSVTILCSRGVGGVQHDQ